MEKVKRLLFWAIVASLAASAVADPLARRDRNGVVQYDITTGLASAPGVAPVAGELRVRYDEQGEAVKQNFDLTVSGLDGASSYVLAALIGDETNAVPVASFTTTGMGKSRVELTGSGAGGKREPLPDRMRPLTTVRAVSIVNGAGQTVAYARVDTAMQYQYAVKRTIASPDARASASLNLFAKRGLVTFRLAASGLGSSSSYHLAFNSNVVSTATSDARGRLQFNTWPSGSPAAVDVTSLQVLDAAGRVVLDTALP